MFSCNKCYGLRTATGKKEKNEKVIEAYLGAGHKPH